MPTDILMKLPLDDKTEHIFHYKGTEILGTTFNVGGASATEQALSAWSPNREPVSYLCNDTTPIDRVIFHLTNFTEFWGRTKIDLSGNRTLFAAEDKVRQGARTRYSATTKGDRALAKILQGKTNTR